MPKLLEIEVRSRFKVWVRYDDGTEGEVDFGDLAGRGVFAAWDNPGVFESASLGPHGQLVWGDEIDLCPDATYMRLTGKSPDEVFPTLKKAGASA